MSPRLDAETRKALSAAQAKVREILDPINEAKKIERAKNRRSRERRVGQTAEGQRKPRKRESDYLNWIRGLACVNCGKPPRSEAAHVRAGYPESGWRPTGMGEKPDDRRSVPLCANCHRQGPKAQHQTKERAWWAERGIYPPELCAALSEAYEANQDGAAVVRRFSQSPRRQGEEQ